MVLDEVLAYLNREGTGELFGMFEEYCDRYEEEYEDGEDETIYDRFDDESEYVAAMLEGSYFDVGGLRFKYLGRGYNGVAFTFGDSDEYVLKSGSDGYVLAELRDVSYVVNVIDFTDSWMVVDRVYGDRCDRVGSYKKIRKLYRKKIEELALALLGWVAYDLNYGNVIDTGEGLVIVDVGEFVRSEDFDDDYDSLMTDLEDCL